uniref:2',5'-phosphodiesterase 12 n=1 Tax=Anas platyrhynchos TaxID=8839 RepID=A0A8B9SHY1_ANAPL
MWQRLRAALGRLRAGGPAPGPVPVPAGMERAVVRCVPAEPKLSVRLVLPDGSARHMQRDQEEPLGRALARLAATAAKGRAKAAKKSKKARAEPGEGEEAAAAAAVPAVRLFSRDGLAVAEEVPNAAAWQDGAVLQVGEARYRVERNPPAVTELRLPRSLLAGFPVCPKVSAEFARRPADGEGGEGDAAWVEEAEGTERVFTPCNALVGLRLKLRCTPRRWGAALRAALRGGEQRARGGRSWRLFSRTVLYPYCAPYALEIDYRQNLLKKELAGYSADLICLQEVDKTVFRGQPGLFKIKEKQHEGLATFYRRDKFSLLSQHDIVFSEALLSDPLHKELCDKLTEYPAVREKVLQRSSVLQVSVLQSATDPSKKICVANTHLYWHPKGGNIRLIQIAVALSHLKHVACDLHPSIPVIFCGDFNSTPSSGTYSFISSGGIAEDHEDWVSNGEEERCNMPLTHPFKLQSACGEPAYTNYVGGFHGCLDYIFIDKTALEVEQVIPLPSHEEVTTHQALPSVSHPSDHIALICDLKWK